MVCAVRAQKVLSKPINAQISREVRAQITSDTSLGATERRERAEETTAAMSGDVLRAHPWQSSQTLSLGSHEVLCWLAWRYCLDLPSGLQPSRECFGSCSHVGTPKPVMLNTPARCEMAALAEREWLSHAVRSCVKSGGVRRLCHDAVLRVLFDMMKSAGYEDVEMEDRWWDEGDGEAKDTRRPDIVAFNPRIRRRVVIDVVGAWAVQPGGARGAWRRAGHSADGKALFKWGSYNGALERQKSGDRGWLAASESKDEDIFVPFAFEVGGAWGTEAEEFLKESKKVAEHCRNGVGDLSHWSAINWGGHWRQRIGVEIARGLARCIERAATGGRVEGSSARSRSQEWDPSCC